MTLLEETTARVNSVNRFIYVETRAAPGGHDRTVPAFVVEYSRPKDAADPAAGFLIQGLVFSTEQLLVLLGLIVTALARPSS